MPLVDQKLRPLVFVEDEPSERSVNGWPVVSTADFLAMPARSAAIAVGDPGSRAAIAKRLEAAGVTPFEIRSPRAHLMPPFDIGPGAIICAFVSIHPNVRIGSCFHANIYSYVAHDCDIGEFVTFAPRVNCNGNVHIRRGAYIGTAAVIKNGSSDKPLVIGEGAIVGQGAVVLHDVPAGAVVVGNPARIMDVTR
jgi:sugar O-acyltransferase (sialic acid O-acetyltransferase NeuD family)